ncbi:MAG: hypothetical protein ACKOJF_06560, partial [Planctomycetaceae bacterium]
ALGGLVAVAAGCPQPHQVSVTMKGPVTAESDAGAPTEAGSAAAPAGYGNLFGQITLDGTAPEVKFLHRKGDGAVKDSTVCAAEDTPDESIVVNAANKGLANVVVYLDKAPAGIKPELATPPSEPVVFDQKGCRFLPHIVAVRVGQPIHILSDDGVPHNTHTFPDRNPGFNQGISPNERKGVPLVYVKAEQKPLKVTCDYHAWMTAYHFPIDHPYFAVTDADGKFKIQGLPAGKHVLKIWHEKAGGGFLDRKITVDIKADADTEQNLTYAPAKFAGLEVQTPTIALSELKSGRLRPLSVESK